MNNIPTPRIDNAFKNPSYKNPRMNATLDSVYQEGKKLEKELVAAQRERDEAREEIERIKNMLKKVRSMFNSIC
jgi:septal ring factor EnvC (AmiA/AmiB activator)